MAHGCDIDHVWLHIMMRVVLEYKTTGGYKEYCQALCIRSPTACAAVPVTGQGGGVRQCIIYWHRCSHQFGCLNIWRNGGPIPSPTSVLIVLT